MPTVGLHGIDLGVLSSLHPIETGSREYSAAVTYDAASEAIFAAFTTPPTTTRKGQIDTCVLALKSAGVWTKLDALYALAAADAQAAKINWVNPGTYNATEVNAPTFTADRGFTGASTKYLDTGFNPATAPSPKFTQNSANVFAWARTSLAEASALIGNNGTSVLISPKSTDNNYYLRINRIPSHCTAASATSVGFWTCSRVGSTSTNSYKNGVAGDTDAGVAAAVASENLWLLRYSTNYSTNQIALAGVGSGLTGTEVTNLYNAVNTYLVAVGAA